MTYREICARLSHAGIESADWDAACLLEHFCGADRLSIKTDPDRNYSTPELEEALRRREERYPLQYLLGEWSFYRQTYEVSPDCLIPRADTECLVEEAIRLLPPNARFADLCTGSGCIAISVLAERRDTRAVAVDKFAPTLALAERNAVRNGVSDRFLPQLSDVLSSDFAPAWQELDAILANPPYICTEVLDTLEPELFAEPRAALDGGDDGLLFYRRILQTQAKYLRPNGFFLFEIGFDQAQAMETLGREYGFSECRILHDYGGNPRVVSLHRKDA